jgi:hypothetical protein
MLILIILTTCARDNYIRKLLLCNDYDMWEDDVEDHNLQELLQEIAWLMVKCVVVWSFVFLQDSSFWNFILCFNFSEIFFIWKFSESSCDYKFGVFQLQDIRIQ